MERRILSILTVTFITTGIFALFVVTRQQKEEGQNPLVPLPDPTATLNITNISPTPLPLRATSTLSVNNQYGWDIYRSNKFSFALAYPPGSEVREQGPSSVSFIALGPTQTKIDDELTDGLILTLTEDSYTTNTLSDHVSSERNQQVSDPINEIVSEIGTQTLGGKDGQTFSVTNIFGNTTYFYLPLKNKSYIRAAYIIADPHQLDHMGNLNTIISSLTY
jgi:hypothetical protein